jgi:hypothetical protein
MGDVGGVMSEGGTPAQEGTKRSSNISSCNQRPGVCRRELGRDLDVNRKRNMADSFAAEQRFADGLSFCPAADVPAAASHIR